MSLKKAIFTISKNNDIRNWQKYHLDKDFEIYVVDNGNITLSEHPKTHVMKPVIKQSELGHVNQQEYLMNNFYKDFKEKDTLLYFIDDDEYVVQEEPLKGNTYLNWKIFNGEYFPMTDMNETIKPVVISCQEGITLKIHQIISMKPVKIYDGNNSEITYNQNHLKGSFKNYLEHHQFESVEDFNKRILVRPQFERMKYLKLRSRTFFECSNIKQFQMCVILDDYDRMETLQKIYPMITFFICSSVVPQKENVETVPMSYWYCPEEYIFRYAEENSFDIVLKRASKMKTDVLDIEDEYKPVNIYKTIHHYPILNHSTKIIRKFKEYGQFSFYDICLMNARVRFLKKYDDEVFESKSFKIECERLKSTENDVSIGESVEIDLLKALKD